MRGDLIDHMKCRTERPILYMMVAFTWVLVMLISVVQLNRIEAKLDALQPCVQQVSK